MDYDLFRAINDFTARHDGFESVLDAYVGASEPIFVALLAMLALAVWGRRRTELRRAAAAGGLSAALGLAMSHAIAAIVDRARPYEAHPGEVHLFIDRSTDPSFPSDHATAAFAIALAIWLHDRRWGAVALAMALVLAFGRIALGAHYPADVAAGALLGCIAALMLWLPFARRPLHGLADLVSRRWDELVGRGAALIRRQAAR